MLYLVSDDGANECAQALGARVNGGNLLAVYYKRPPLREGLAICYNRQALCISLVRRQNTKPLTRLTHRPSAYRQSHTVVAMQL